MGREINRLNARTVATISRHGRHADGGGLYLSISPNGGRRWVFLYRWHSKPTEIGFGSARDVTLARARERATAGSRQSCGGRQPKDARKPTKGATFGECADRLIEGMRPSWRNAKHAAQWKMTLQNYAAPLRRLPVERDHDRGCFVGSETALAKQARNRLPCAGPYRTRSRCRQGARPPQRREPARWRGHLDQLLPKVSGSCVAIMPRMPLHRMCPFSFGDLQLRQASAALALEFAILTAARSGEYSTHGTSSTLTARYGRSRQAA